jgi:hypothetical protein
VRGLRGILPSPTHRAAFALAVVALAALVLVEPPNLHLPVWNPPQVTLPAALLGDFDARNRAVSPAVFFGRKLEPRGRTVLHGAGQTDDPTFREYTSLLTPSHPMLYMSYVDLKDDLPGFFSHLHSDLSTYPDYLVPQIGLSLNAGQVSQHYERDIAEGRMDDRIAVLCMGLKSLDRPVFLRIGYEFNGPWNGYSPAPYIAAFRHIVQTLRTCSPETAAVWDFAAAAPGSADPMRFYPGDDFVDWWAINLFSEESLTSSETHAFLHAALAHRFPVMIAESTPRGHPVTEGAKVVDGWYKPFFGLIHRSPQIKAFCYINWDWRQYPQWADWGDARIQDDPAILAFYRREVADPLFQPATSESATRTLLGLPTKTGP